MTDSNRIQECANSYIAARRARLNLEKEVEALRENETAYREELLDIMRTGKIATFGATGGEVRYKSTPEPKPEDWHKIRAYIRDNDAWDLMQMRLNVVAVRERKELGEEVPGVGWFPVEKITIAKEKQV